MCARIAAVARMSKVGSYFIFYSWEAIRKSHQWWRRRTINNNNNKIIHYSTTSSLRLVKTGLVNALYIAVRCSPAAPFAVAVIYNIQYDRYIALSLRSGIPIINIAIHKIFSSNSFFWIFFFLCYSSERVYTFIVEISARGRSGGGYFTEH